MYYGIFAKVENTQRILTPKYLNWVQHLVSPLGLSIAQISWVLSSFFFFFQLEEMEVADVVAIFVTRR